MSLINDALKRANQQPPPPPGGPALRPATPEAAPRRGMGLVVPILFVVLALGGLFYVWQSREKEDLTASARVPAGPQNPANEPAPPAPAPRPAAVQPAPAPAPAVSTVPGLAAATNVIAQAAALAAAPAPVNAVMEPAPQPAPAEPSAPPKPAPLKLQVIVFDPARPSATINGRTVFVGDKLGPFRVSAITRDSVTLSGSGLDTRLSLP